MTIQEIFARLQSAFGEEIISVTPEGALMPFVTVKPGRWLEIARVLRIDEAFAFDYLKSLCGVDYPQQNAIACVVHLFSYQHRHDCAVKIMVDRAAPKLASVASVWPAADWHEREAFDLFGMVFEGHPNLRRILLPDDWEGHPLRKDYQIPETYHGIVNVV